MASVLRQYRERSSASKVWLFPSPRGIGLPPLMAGSIEGSRTALKTPEALAPFLVALVRDRGAAGVVSTEVRVWEQLASEFTELFLKAFLPGRAAADALLDARWSLLRLYNPHGLIYTLYASADLVLPPVSISASS